MTPWRIFADMSTSPYGSPTRTTRQIWLAVLTCLRARIAYLHYQDTTKILTGTDGVVLCKLRWQALRYGSMAFAAWDERCSVCLAIAYD